jgi:hypothetical protein
MISGLSISGVCEVVSTFLCGVGSEQLADGCDEGFERACRRRAHQVFQLGEDLFDRVQIGRVFGKEEQLGAGRPDRPANGFSFVAAKVIHDYEVARRERGDQHLLDIGFEAFAIDRTVKHPRRLDTIMPKGGHKGQGFPVAVRNFGHEPRPSRRPSPERRHVGLGPRFIDEDQALWLDPLLTLCPSGTPACDVGAIAFAGDDGFF